MPLLFSYGTLRQEPVQLATFGRLLDGHDDELVGFELSQVKIADSEMVAAGGATHHANVLFNGSDRSRVTGTVFRVTDSELALADTYEQRADYTRIGVRLVSGDEAWVYVEARSAPGAATLSSSPAGLRP